MKIKLLNVLLLLACSAVANGGVIFTFEDQNATWNPDPRTGALTSLSMTQGLLTVTITRLGGLPFDVVANTGAQTKPAEWGNRSLDPFFSTGPGGFLVNFSIPVNGVSVMLGDYGDDDDELFLEVYSGLNATDPLGSTGETLTASGTTFDYRTLSLSAPGIQSAFITGGGYNFGTSQFTDTSVFLDNLDADIPEPGSLLLMAPAVLAGLVWRTRRRGQTT